MAKHTELDKEPEVVEPQEKVEQMPDDVKQIKAENQSLQTENKQLRAEKHQLQEKIVQLETALKEMQSKFGVKEHKAYEYKEDECRPLVSGQVCDKCGYDNNPESPRYQMRPGDKVREPHPLA